MDKLGRWLGIFANVGVVVGIVFLVVQIRQTNTLMRANAFQDRSADLIQIGAMVAESEPLARALSKLNFPNAVCQADQAPLDDLSQLELTLFKQYVMAQLFRLQNLDEQFRHGLVRSEHHEAALRAVQRYLPWAQRLDLPEAKIGQRILSQLDRPVADPFCDRRVDA
jgi:hypothetical protein